MEVGKIPRLACNRLLCPLSCMHFDAMSVCCFLLLLPLANDQRHSLIFAVLSVEQFSHSMRQQDDVQPEPMTSDDSPVSVPSPSRVLLILK